MEVPCLGEVVNNGVQGVLASLAMFVVQEPGAARQGEHAWFAALTASSRKDAEQAWLLKQAWSDVQGIGANDQVCLPQ